MDCAVKDEPKKVFKLLTLIAKAVHLNGEQSEVRRTFDTNGGSIGRQDGCDLLLPDPDRQISRIQARILHVDGRYLVRNASTSNPMYVNGVELSPGSSQAIGDGNELRAGSYVMAVSQDEKSPRLPSSPSDGQKMSISARMEVTPEFSAPEERKHAPSLVDPLLALGSGAGASADPFGDLLGKASPVNSAHENEQDTWNLASPLPLSSVVNEDLHGRRTLEESLPCRNASPEVGQKNLMESLAAEKASVDIPPMATRELGRSLSVDLRPLITTSFDPRNPFSDLLAQAAPADAETAFGAPRGEESSLPSHGAAIDAVIWGIKHAAQPSQAVSDTAQQLSILDNPFARPVGPEPLRDPRAGGALGEVALPKLAGDPFADLMGAPVEEHLANIPLPDPASSRRLDYIPEDFNPLAIGGVAQRNSSDPLTQMGLNTRGLADVLPKKTIDSVYNPGGESPTTLAVDPLKSSQNRSLRVEQSTDPLKLFANDGPGLISGAIDAPTGGSTRDDAREMVAYFRAPVPRVGSGLLTKAEDRPSDDEVGVSPPAVQDLPGEPVVVGMPTSVETGTTLPLTANHANGAFMSSLASGNLAGVTGDGERERPEPDTTQTDSTEKSLPQAEPSAAPPSATAVPPQSSSLENASPSEAPKAEELMNAFKRGAGLRELSTTSVTPELMETLGRLLQVAVHGTVSLLAARAAIKQEIHLSVTLINPKSNNPLKFLPDGHSAMLQMLGPKMPGFMTPVEAMEEAFSDLLIHQTAIAAGTQATIAALFRRFDPGAIESQYPKNGVGEKLSPSMYHARLWSMYADQYRMIKEETKDDFFKRLGAEFHEAYNREYRIT